MIGTLMAALAAAGFDLVTVQRKLQDVSKPGDEWRRLEPTEEMILLVRRRA
jgi:hypothetical protein